MTKPAGNVTTTPSSQIGSEINQIDQFLQSLRMGTYDPLATATETAAAPKTSASGPSVGSEVGSKVESAKMVVSAGTREPQPVRTSGSLGMQLISQLSSSSSNDSDSDSEESSSSESSEEEASMVAIE